MAQTHPTGIMLASGIQIIQRIAKNVIHVTISKSGFKIIFGKAIEIRLKIKIWGLCLLTVF